jgi:phosphoesterase RecJ-like protein
MNKLCEIAELIKAWDKIEIFTHIHPDGDALGSSYALASALGRMGKTVRVTVNDSLPSTFGYIHSVTFPEFEPEVTVTVDVASRTLLGDFPSDKVINLAIDHHENNTTGAEVLFCDPKRAACGEIIFDIIEKLGVAPDRYIAECLYTAIATDTGCFKFSNTNAKTFEIASRLCAHAPDGNFGYLNTPLFITKSRKQIALEAEILSSLGYHFDSKVAISVITDELLKRLEIGENEAAGIEQLSKIPEGVELGITLKERQSGFKVSMRSSDNIDCAKICAFFGGGGHHSAAGCFIQGKKDEVLKKIISHLEESDIL